MSLEFWTGDGGNAYMRRNEVFEAEVKARARSLKMIFSHLKTPLTSLLEVGCGPGANIRAIREFDTHCMLFAVEPNAEAREAVVSLPVHVYPGHASSIAAADASFDLVMTAGVLIHIHPDQLADAMGEIVRVSRRYVLCIEYFAPHCEEVPSYPTGLWRNDFGRLYIERCQLRPVAHGFFWRTVDEGYDNCVWWLLEK